MRGGRGGGGGGGGLGKGPGERYPANEVVFKGSQNLDLRPEWSPSGV